MGSKNRNTTGFPCRSLTAKGRPCGNRVIWPRLYCHRHLANPRPWFIDVHAREPYKKYRSAADEFPVLGKIEKEVGADPSHIARLFGYDGGSDSPVDLDLPPGARISDSEYRERFIDWSTFARFHFTVKEFGLDELARPSPTTKLALAAGRETWEQVLAWRRDPAFLSLPAGFADGRTFHSLVVGPDRLEALDDLANFYVRFEEARAILVNLQSGTEIQFDDESLRLVLSKSKSLPLQKRETWQPPRLWAYFKIAFAATYLHLEPLMPSGGREHHWRPAHTLADGRRAGQGKPAYKKIALEQTARIGKALEPVWLHDLEAKYVKTAVDWLLHP